MGRFSDLDIVLRARQWEALSEWECAYLAAHPEAIPDPEPGTEHRMPELVRDAWRARRYASLTPGDMADGRAMISQTYDTEES